MTDDASHLAQALEIASSNAGACRDQWRNKRDWRCKSDCIAAHAINVIDTLADVGLIRGYRERAMAHYMALVLSR